MKSIKNILLWILVGLFSIIALGTIPSIACFAAILVALLLLPLPKWQLFIQKYIKKTLKVIIIVILIILILATFPQSNTPAEDKVPSIPTTNETTIHTSTPSTTGSSPLPTTVPTTTPTTTPTTAPTPVTNPSTEPVHVHSFSAATCTAPKTCSCGATEGSATGHNWKEATYDAPKTCSVCGVTEGNPIEKPGSENYHGHVYTGGEKSEKFHYEDNCAGKYSHEITWDEVSRRGLEPCGNCVLN